MLYKKSHIVAINTTQTAPDTKVLKVSKGILNLWVVYMTQESANYLKVRVLYHGVQVYPFNPDEQIKAWFNPIGVSDNLKIDTPPYELTVEAWNSAPTNSHEYHVHANIEPAKPVTIVQQAEPIFSRLSNLLGGP